MKKILTSVLLIASCMNLCNAQGFEYDSKTDIGNGLYKVSSRGEYGIIDNKENVVVSIEFEDIRFNEGKALLIKENVLYGTVDSLGTAKYFDTKYKIHPKYRYIYDGYIIVGNTKSGFITEDGKPLRIKSKIKGLASPIGKKIPTMFDDISPFVDGYAAVYIKHSGWKHIDKDGNERYILADKKAKALFRSSIYKGECIIVTDDGIKQYQENNTSQAVVKRILSTSATQPQYIQDSTLTKLAYKEGTLTLDSIMRVSTYETATDTIIFIEKPQKVVTEKIVTPPTDTLSIKEDLKAEVVYKNPQANEQGKAYTEIKLINTSEEKFEELSVTLKCAGASREWNGSLNGNSEVKISFNIPARFSSTSIKRNIIVEIKNKDENMEFEFPITIRRYTPIRSR